MGQIIMEISHREIYALVDINNCYVSCERLFNPKLIGLPVVVLSNNDGCVVSRSEDYVELNYNSSLCLLVKNCLML